MSFDAFKKLSAVIDCDALLTRCLDNLDFAESMIALFLGHGGEELEEMSHAVQCEDWEQTAKIAHRFHGACANAAAKGMQTLVTELRAAAKNGNKEEALTNLAKLQDEWNRFTEMANLYSAADAHGLAKQ